MPLALTPAVAAARAAALAPYGGAGGPVSAHLDALARLAALSCGAPIGVVGLADAERVRFAGRHGQDAEGLPLADALCAHALSSPDGLLVVPDAARDPRFARLPPVRDDGVRFYAARTLLDPAGTPVGTVCVFDGVPRTGLLPEEEDALRTLAVAAQAELERWRHAPSVRSPGAVAAGLRRALVQEEVVAHLQPLWSVAGGGPAQLVGAEALVRWQHPERGLLLPGAFLPDVAAAGLEASLGEVVLRQSLARVARWEREGRLSPDFRLHVNVAPAQLHEGGLPDLLRRLARQTGAPLTRLCLEITETALLDEAVFPRAAAQELVDLGVRLVLDDFGTGYSSLALLRRYPVAGLKVDRSFVQGLGREREDAVVVATVLGLARELGLEAVCEGVETAEQLAHVRRLGGAAVQGFLLGRASGPGEWEQRLLPAAAEGAAPPRP